MRKKLLNTKVTVKLRKSEYKEEWYLTVEAYPVNDPSQPGKKRIVESLNRIIRSCHLFPKITPKDGYCRSQKEISHHLYSYPKPRLYRN